jgi:thymidylate synthase ThyX
MVRRQISVKTLVCYCIQKVLHSEDYMFESCVARNASLKGKLFFVGRIWHNGDHNLIYSLAFFSFQISGFPALISHILVRQRCVYGVVI